MPDFTVRRYGTDSVGRAIYMTAYMRRVRTQALAELDFGDEVVCVQGAFMTRNGGGATKSAGYHDQAGCWDERTRNLTDAQIDQLVAAYRRNGIAAWRRDQRHGGMDQHVHCLLGTDRPLAAGAAQQWRDYKAGLDGLARRGPDYEWRPSPLVLTPPEEDDMPAYKDWTPADKKALADDVARAVILALRRTKIPGAGSFFPVIKAIFTSRKGA